MADVNATQMRDALAWATGEETAEPSTNPALPAKLPCFKNEWNIFSISEAATVNL